MNLREWALPVYTILMQLAIGALFALWVIKAAASAKYGPEKMNRIALVPVLIIFSTIVLAVIGSHFHLSKPYHSFLAMRNFRTSWLSREVVFTVIVLACVGALLFALQFVRGRHRLKDGLGWAAILFGLATVYSMASIYLLPSQIAWNSFVTVVSYYAVMFLLGTTSLLVILLMDLQFFEGGSPEDSLVRTQVLKRSALWLTVVATLGAVVALLASLYQIEFLRGHPLPSAQASLRLLLELYRPLLVVRIGLTVVGILWLVAVVAHAVRTRRPFAGLLAPVYVASIMVLIGEIIERFLFYATHVRIGI